MDLVERLQKMYSIAQEDARVDLALRRVGELNTGYKGLRIQTVLDTLFPQRSTIDHPQGPSGILERITYSVGYLHSIRG